MRKNGNIFFGVLMIFFSFIFASFSIVAVMPVNLTIFYILSAVAIIVFLLGIVNVIRCLLDDKVIKRGKQTVATVKNMPAVSDKKGLMATAKMVKIDFEYKNDGGKTYSGSAVLPAVTVKTVSVGDALPILLYKNRAVIDYKTLQTKEA